MARLPSCLLVLATLAGCAEQPCRGIGGHRLFVFADATRTGGTDARVYTRIQDALDAADPGTAVCVGAGTWRELLKIETDGVRLVGSGAELTTLAPPDPAADPRNGNETLLDIAGRGVLVGGMTVDGGLRGVVLETGASATLQDLVASRNAVGLLAREPSGLSLDGVSLKRNATLGAWIGGSEPVHATRLVVEGNGDAERSEVGGLLVEAPLVLDDAHFRDNAGTEAGSLYATAGLLARDSLFARSAETGGAPRVQVEGPVELARVQIETRGSAALVARCSGSEAFLENVAVAEIAEGPLPDHVTLDACSGHVLHATIANLGGGVQGAGLALSGDGELLVGNSALLGYQVPIGVGQYRGELEEVSNYSATASEAALLRPLPTATDLRPQSDSPLVDAGADFGLSMDLERKSRPVGLGPDIGAHERGAAD